MIAPRSLSIQTQTTNTGKQQSYRSLCLHQMRHITANTSRSCIPIIAVVADEVRNSHSGHTAVLAP